MKKNSRTPMIKAYDKADRVLGKGLLLAGTVPITVGDTLIEMIKKKRISKKEFDKVSAEIKQRLNVSEGRGRHFMGAEL